MDKPISVGDLVFVAKVCCDRHLYGLGIPYTVNDGTWRRCTPEFCHTCLAYLNAQHVLLPYPEPVQ